MEKLIFGIQRFPAGARTYFLVWSAPEPEDIDTEPEYVKPLAVRMSLRMAEKALHEFEESYNAERLRVALTHADKQD